MRTLTTWQELSEFLTETEGAGLTPEELMGKFYSSEGIRKLQQRKPGTRVLDLNARPDYVLELGDAVRVPIPTDAGGWLFWLNCNRTVRRAAELGMEKRETGEQNE